MFTEKKFKNVAIIGGGLIGSSLAHSIRENHLCDNLKILNNVKRDKVQYLCHMETKTHMAIIFFGN